jgi:hypothetical protein
MSEHMHVRGREPFPPRWAFLVLAVMILVGLGWTVYNQVTATADKNVAQANSKTLAQDIQTICEANGKLLVDDRDLCAKAEKVQQAPTEAIQGPKGEPGKDGKDGRPGTDGVPGPGGTPGPGGPPGSDGAGGPPGSAGVSGSDGSDGMNGAAGKPGQDGATGAQGPPGVDGSTGPIGPQGEPGRGIASAYCGDDGRWSITYTDGAVQDGGQCRETTTIGVIP